MLGMLHFARSASGEAPDADPDWGTEVSEGEERTEFGRRATEDRADDGNPRNCRSELARDGEDVATESTEAEETTELRWEGNRRLRG